MEPFPILFVDDEESVLRALGREMRGLRWPHDLANGPSEAFSKLDAASYAVVISDFRMPEMDGVEFLAQVRERWPESERVLLTAFADEDAMERGINQAGISRFLRKPWDNKVLASVLDEARGQYQLRRDHEVLHQKLKHRNDELNYLNQLLRDRVEESARTLSGFRRRWDVALNAISDPLILVGAELRIEGANEAALALCEGSLEQVEGRPCHQVLFSRPKRCGSCPIGSGTTQFDVEGTGRTYDARAYPLPGLTESHLCIYRDVTDKVAFAREAAQVEKMAAIGRLSGGVAHEINNPLHGILSFLQLAQRPNVSPEKLSHYHETIRECALRCRDIVKSLKDFSRKATPSERAPVTMGTICQKARVLFENLKGRHIDWPENTNGYECLANANQIQQVLVNLVQNAVDASPEAATVRVSLGIEDQDLFIAVDDEGSGVSDEEAEHIFEPFYTTKPEGVGTGLGLAISHTIMKDHNGGLRVSKSDHGGARFELRLPRLHAGEPEGGTA